MKTAETVNVGIQSPVAIGDSLHGTFDKATGVLINFNVTDLSCNTDYTNQLTQAQRTICKQELQKYYHARRRTNS